MIQGTASLLCQDVPDPLRPHQVRLLHPPAQQPLCPGPLENDDWLEKQEGKGVGDTPELLDLCFEKWEEGLKEKTKNNFYVYLWTTSPHTSK